MLYLLLKTAFRTFAASTSVVLANLTKFFALGSLQKHIIAVNNWKEKILVNF